jgi:hypothetical protein
MTPTAFINQISENGHQQGYLAAMDVIAKLPTITGHPMETETIDRIYEALEQGYTERYRGGAA